MTLERREANIIKPSESWMIHSIHASENDVSIIVGQSDSCLNDQTLLLYCSLAHQYNGTVLMADPQPYNHADDRRLRYLRKKGVLYGEGGALDYRDEILTLSTLGVPLITPEWLGKTSSSSHLPLPNAYAHKIIDHHTTGFLACSAKTDRSMPQSHQNTAATIISDSFREYHRVLRVGGKVMYQSDFELLSSMGIMDQIEFIDMIQAIGFLVEFHRVKDTTQISVPHLLASHFSAFRSEGIGRMYYHIKNTDNGAVFSKNAVYDSPDFFVCTKI